ncbi:dihydropteroate synthase [Neptuniibacter sp.]|uniref:dihydropteroate synthase n=1 Tax=Neptuniibacter sp. TaxID=1962643 RepID=UPI002602E39E|nr:dihydropteroate synthase [Neptuniibacter sp.]MCP4597741.1 dihydropteroate synthase [Neptuniibacter sp.]
MRILNCGQYQLDLSKTHVMGILNVTPDSFSDGGNLYSGEGLLLDKVLHRAEKMLADGATILDIGGESTRPGAVAVSLQEEMDRVLPVVERIAAELEVVISVDTSSPEVMTQSAALGAGLINDVRALGREGALKAAAATQLPVCLMHMQGSPATMQDRPVYEDVLDDVEDFLLQRISDCEKAGITKERLILDPGFGFGKTVEHNLRLLNNLQRLKKQGLPLLIGTSRKSMIGAVLGREVDQRLPGSLATVAVAVMQGAEIIRVHDVAETVDVVKMTRAVMAESQEV